VSVQDQTIAELADLSTHVWYDVGPHFTCREADALINVFEELGLQGHAQALLEGHAAGDEEGDEHWTGQCPACGTGLDDDGYCTDVGCSNCGKAMG
jgi:hypothetical protein